MYKLITCVIVSVALLASGAVTLMSNRTFSEGTLPVEPVNRVLGDASFAKTFEMLPAVDTDEVLRIRTHLAYVEKLLRAVDVSHLDPDVRSRRFGLLDRLNEYWRAGIFPSNDGSPARRPNFIDSEGRICAVGYLIERSAGRALAERINDRYQFAFVDDMGLPEISEWASMAGFSVDELALIQPMYGLCRMPPCESARVEEDRIASGAEYTGLALSGIAMGANAIMIGADRPNFVTSAAGFALGTATVAVSSVGVTRNPELGIASGILAMGFSGINLYRLARRQTEAAKEPPPLLVDVIPVESEGAAVRFRMRF